MKKIIILIAFITLLSFSAAAQDSSFSLDAGAGLWYHMYPSTGNSFLNILQSLFAFRGGGYADLVYNLNGSMGVGVELGLAYMSATSGDVTSSLFDVPAYVFGRLTFGGIKLQPYGGVLIVGAVDSSGAAFDPLLTGGARVVLGHIFLEASMIFSDDVYPRFGLGWQLNDLLNF